MPGRRSAIFASWRRSSYRDGDVVQEILDRANARLRESRRPLGPHPLRELDWRKDVHTRGHHPTRGRRSRSGGGLGGPTMKKPGEAEGIRAELRAAVEQALTGDWQAAHEVAQRHERRDPRVLAPRGLPPHGRRRGERALLVPPLPARAAARGLRGGRAAGDRERARVLNGLPARISRRPRPVCSRTASRATCSRHMNSRLRCRPPKHRFAQRSGRSMRPIGLPDGIEDASRRRGRPRPCPSPSRGCRRRRRASRRACRARRR